METCTATNDLSIGVVSSENWAVRVRTKYLVMMYAAPLVHTEYEVTLAVMEEFPDFVSIDLHRGPLHMVYE